MDFSTTILEAHSLGSLRDNLTRIVFNHPYSSSRIRYRLNAELLCILILFFFRVVSACAFKVLSIEKVLNYKWEFVNEWLFKFRWYSTSHNLNSFVFQSVLFN